MLGTPESLSGFSVVGPLERESPDDDKTPRGASLNLLPAVSRLRAHLRCKKGRGFLQRARRFTKSQDVNNRCTPI